MKISVVTPTIRENSLELNKKCLERQILKDFEWIIVSPFKYRDAIWIPEPQRREGDLYNLNKCWNLAFKKAKGELIVSIVDLLWFPPETLEHLWTHYEANPMACIGLLGNQYDQIVNDKPEHLVWRDPREKEETTFYQIPPYDLELCLASLPKKGIFDVGGIDEEFDKFPAWSEKELCCRMEKFGYTFWLDQSIQYRAIQHPRLTSDWDEKYPLSTTYFQKCYKDIQEGRRLKLDFLTQKVYKKENGLSSEKENPAIS